MMPQITDTNRTQRQPPDRTQHLILIQRDLPIK